MNREDSRLAPVSIVARRAELTGLFDNALPQLSEYGETAALFLVVCAFWGLVLYVALTSALP
jgi:hypothetical protein